MKKTKQKNNKKNWYFFAIAIIISAAFFVRTWNFADSFYFELDQSRDVNLIKAAYEKGPGELPLLGPRAAGTFLRLGPIFYYFQYASAKIFGSVEPFILAYPDLLFSLLTIPLLFYLLRQFFDKKMSLLLTVLYSFSFIATQYSRFAWNPNSVPFWVLLYILGLYKASVTDKSKAGWWFLLAAFAYGIVSQLHFTALLALPIVGIIFWIFRFPKKVRPIYWVGAVTILVFLYLPMIVSEGYTDFYNYKNFRYALSSKGDEYSGFSKISQSLKLHGMQYSQILSSYGNIESKVFVIGFVALIILASWLGWKTYKTKPPKEEVWKLENKKTFLIIIASWFVVFGALFSYLAFEVTKPRFWLLVIFIPYIALGLIFQWIIRWNKKHGWKIVLLGAGILLLANLYAVGYWYWTIDKQITGGGFYSRDLAIKQKERVGLGQMRLATKIMSKRAEEEGKMICFYSAARFRRSYDYIFEYYHPKTETKRITFSKDTNEKCVFFSIKNGGNKEKVDLPKDHQDKFKAEKTWEIGTIKIWEITRIATVAETATKKEEAIIQEKKNEAQEKANEEETETNKPEKIRRTDRVFWKDIF